MIEKTMEWNKWDFPNCVAGDGKHIRFFCPKKVDHYL